MPIAITVRDETTSGKKSNGVELAFPTERITVRELIRERVYQEVDDFNRRADDKAGTIFNGLVQPTDSEATLNGYRLRDRRRGKHIDWKEQFERACEAFERSSVLVLVGDRQAERLDEEITLTRGVEVTFLKLVPLVGG